MTGKYQPKRNRETGSFLDAGMEVGLSKEY